MKKFKFRIVALSTEVAETARQQAASGAQDHMVMTVDSPGSFPCRHCLRWVEPGERIVLFPYASIPLGYPYSETGPIVVHEQACRRYAAADEYPSEFRNGRVFRAYNKENRIIDAKIANGSTPEAVTENLFDNPQTAFVHARSVAHGCYTFAIERA